MPLKIGKWIRGWKLGQWFKRMFKNISEEAKVLLPLVSEFVNNFKEYVDSPILDIFAALTKGKWDDKKVEQLREVLPQVIFDLDIANTTANITDPEERMKAIIGLFKFANDEAKDDFYHKLSYRILYFLADGKITRSEAIQIAEMYYQYIHKNAA